MCNLTNISVPTIYAKILPNRPFWIVSKTVQVSFGEGYNRSFIIQRGVTSDLASVPFFFRWLIPKHGPHTRAAIIHDALYRDPSTRKVHVRGEINMEKLNREDADILLREVAVMEGMSRWKSFLMFWAVRFGGRSAWENEHIT